MPGTQGSARCPLPNPPPQRGRVREGVRPPDVSGSAKIGTTLPFPGLIRGSGGREEWGYRSGYQAIGIILLLALVLVAAVMPGPAPELEKRMRRHLRPCRGPWHVDETYIRVNGQWRYLYRAVDGTGQTIDFLLSAKRDKKAAKRFFKRALGREHTRNPREVVTDRLKSYPGALREMKQKGELWRFARHRRGRWLNNRVEQDHRRIKRLTRPMLGFQ